MSTLKLGLHKLPAAEVVLIQSLLRLYGDRSTSAKWALADCPPWDAVLVDATTAEPADGIEWPGKTSAVLRITRGADAGRPDTIERPIRPDKLMRWLDQWRPAGADAGAATATAAALPQAAGVAADAPPLTRYRLLRWPPSAVLRNDARRVRLATHLSKRAFNAFELAQISQQAVEDCHGFLRLLRATGFVEAQAEPATPRPAAVPADTAATAAPSRKSTRMFASGLIGGLRRRLGL